MSATHILLLMVQKRPREILDVGVNVDIERGLVLINVTFGNRDLNYVVDDVIVLLESVCLVLNLRIIPQICKLLEPIVEFFRLVDLPTPRIH